MRLLWSCTAVAAILMFGAGPAAASVDLGRVAPWLTVSGAACTSAAGCTFFQGTDDGTDSYTAARNGVITAYSLLAGSSFPGINAVGLRIFRPQPAGAWLLAAQTTDTELAPTAGVVVDIPARVAINAGDHIGMAVEFDGDTAWQYTTATASDTALRVDTAPAPGATIAPADLTPFAAARVNVKARLEADADGDGYGDESQDSCQLDPAHQAAPCTPPAITGLTLTRKKFRVNPRGAVLRTARTPRGSTIAFTLTQPASVQFVVSRKSVGRRVGRKCVPTTRSNRDKKRCVFYGRGHQWSRSALPAGVNALPYSGRYKHGHNGSALLKPGRYRLTAVPANTGGIGVDPVAAADFTVVAH